MLLGYGKNFGYKEAFATPSEVVARKLERQFQQAIPPEIISKMIKSGRLPKPGEGPSPKERRSRRFQTTVIVGGERAGDRSVAVVRGGECGYEETAKMAIESALCIIFNGSLCPGLQEGGVHTPASGLGMPLVERLRRAGIDFRVEWVSAADDVGSDGNGDQREAKDGATRAARTAMQGFEKMSLTKSSL